ncbi:endo-1,4-beta-xylanase [Xanthomonas oryzae]|uniref:endo-1,4-beta-xylanase n=1 Tax=Xanthomonas oryzae TaxID=347 RepID=UPI000949CA4C|nr:endo-1,4-beta-xylanase [Xanthomonas oryzae]OLH31462.1 1,4-beta-xylanase [Xanthomonas oryzae pv. oryzae]
MLKLRYQLTLVLLLGACASAVAGPIAAGKRRVLGSAYSPQQAQGFTNYWNADVPENAGKWGSVEAVRGQMNWGPLDQAYQLAKRNHMQFQFHVGLWGAQQPTWVRNLPPHEQLAAIEHWFAAIAQRYPGIDLMQVANETLPGHNQPDNRRSDTGNYMQALGGTGTTGVDWVLEAFRLARRYFPHTKLMINDYNVTEYNDQARQYLHTIQLLQQEHLIDAIGIQGHLSSNGPSVAVQRANLDLLASTRLPIYITEFDLDGRTDAQQLAAWQRFFPMFWEHPAVRGVNLWGFRHGMWRDNEGAYLINYDGSERPALTWLRSYVASRP